MVPPSEACPQHQDKNQTTVNERDTHDLSLINKPLIKAAVIDHEAESG
jgi:hypothetical protein